VLRTRFLWQLLLLVALSIVVKRWLGSHDDPGSTIRSLGALAPVATVALQCATTTTPVGSTVIPTLNGMLFPLLLAVALNIMGGLVAGVLMYYVWRRGDSELHIHERLRVLPLWARRFARTDLLSLIVMRMLPWAGGNIATFLAGAYRIPLRVHIASVLIGSIPGAVIYALVGAGLVHL
jgi:uncharacterized membrane protein YdjX (TVP38/TMEM64 family)